MRKLFAVSLLVSCSVLRASEVYVFEGTCRFTPPRDAKWTPAEKSQRCFIAIDVTPQRAASSELLMSMVTYGTPQGVKSQLPLLFGVSPDHVVRENELAALAVNRLEWFGSLILGYADRPTGFGTSAFNNGIVRLMGDLPKPSDKLSTSHPKLPRVLSGLLSDFTVPDNLFPPTAVSAASFREAAVNVTQHVPFTEAFQREGLTVFQAIQRLSTYLESRGYTKPKN